LFNHSQIIIAAADNLLINLGKATNAESTMKALAEAKVFDEQVKRHIAACYYFFAAIDKSK